MQRDPDKKPARLWVRLLRSLLLIYVVMALTVHNLVDQRIFQPDESSYSNNERLLHLTTDDGETLTALFIPPPDLDAFTILHCHGNAEDMGHLQWIYGDYTRQGYGVFGFDYRGYGTSSGEPSEAGLYLDIRAAYRYLTQDLAIGPDRILVVGRSLGSGPAIDLARELDVGGLVLESPFKSAYRIALDFPLFPMDRFPNLHKIDDIRIPVLVMHGRQDRTIAFEQGEYLYNKAPDPKLALWLDNADHMQLLVKGGEAYWDHYRQLEELVRQMTER